MLQRSQDAIRYGCDCECDNAGVHKGLVFMVIVMLSYHSSVFYILFSLFTSWRSSFRCVLLWQDGIRWVSMGSWNRGWLRERVVCLFSVGGCASLGWMVLH